MFVCLVLKNNRRRSSIFMVAIRYKNIVGFLAKMKHVDMSELNHMMLNKKNLKQITSSFFSFEEDAMRTKLFHIIVYVAEGGTGEGHVFSRSQSYKSNVIISWLFSPSTILW
jgi:hypothetical protein